MWGPQEARLLLESCRTFTVCTTTLLWRQQRAILLHFSVSEVVFFLVPSTLFCRNNWLWSLYRLNGTKSWQDFWKLPKVSRITVRHEIVQHVTTNCCFHIFSTGQNLYCFHCCLVGPQKSIHPLLATVFALRGWNLAWRSNVCAWVCSCCYLK